VTTTFGSVDVAEVRRRHPIEDVITASGVELHRSGHGFMGCCPFHDDSTASLSVGGKIPDRFHCFGCGASGDVIDYVQRRAGVGFRDAVARLEDTHRATRATRPAVGQRPSQPMPTPWRLISVDRAHEIHVLAWEHLTSKVRHAFAVSYLHNHRGIDVRELESDLAQPVIGHSGRSWSWLTDRLLRDGVSIDELQAVDLAHRSRSGLPRDTFHGRLMVPVRSESGHIEGFIGRKVDDTERGPKYRNPTHTATFDKSQVLYTPRVEPPGARATTVVVEGPLDALAVAAAAARAKRLDEFWPCSTNGVTVSSTQAERVTASGAARIVVAMDGDEAGAEGTQRWVDSVCRGMGQPAMVTRLPDGLDPAEWLAAHGCSGLSAFDAQRQSEPNVVTPRQPGHELVRAIAARSRDPLQETVDTVIPLSLLTTSPRETAELLAQVEAELTRLGLDPAATAIPVLRRRAIEGQSPERSMLLTALAIDHPGPSL
jgi:DNA primase